ncbi:anhydro-N-acetylmuramic acid kinase [soil metagenome]
MGILRVAYYTIRMDKPRLLAGAMSGTSADGVDVAIVRVIGRGLTMRAELIHHHAHPYTPEIREKIFAVRSDGAVRLADLAELGRAVSLAYVEAIHEALRAANLLPADLAAIAAHGQTLYHAPPNTIHWLDPALIAAGVGCAVVSDFRRADCAAGGQGAPLVPFADHLLFRDAMKNRVLLNLGGIANITFLRAGASLSEVIAFDTGPANCVIDHLARKHDVPGGFDRDGILSMQGTPDFQLAFMAVRAWRLVFRPPPKSADTPEMIAAFESMLRELQKQSLSLADQMATACMMSALGVDLALHHCKPRPDEIIASGGGVENPRLMQEIERVTKLPIRRTEELGVPSAAKEAIAFALLGGATLDGEPSNVPSVTGASQSVVLGSITPKN